MSPRILRIVLLVIAVLGLALASYLTYIHYEDIKPLCTAGSSCIKVQSSIYSKLAGVPVALIGLLGYIAIVGSLLIPQGETSRLATMAFTLVGFGFSAYLTYRELFSIHAVCEECATSAVLMTILMVLSVWRFLRSDELPRDVDAAPTGNAGGHEPSTPLSSAS
ncbi:MAG TPA: vitamin K epoxide reductase family protein [Solirubrobacteraceae bacterium]|jgi:uncharacterized membrane protein|nr:vitamin K epoxide reductase family protein [Solirubrobacteraceae bacterium]